MEEFEYSGRQTIVTLADASIIPMLDDLKLQSVTDFRNQCNGSSIRADQILFRIRSPLKMTMTDLLAQEGVSGYNANQNLSWQVSIPQSKLLTTISTSISAPTILMTLY